METVGKEIFRISYYWLRYEFAPSRGQIHAHILAISDIHTEMNIASELNQDKKAKAIFLEHFVKTYFGTTCDYNDLHFEKKISHCHIQQQ